MDEEEQMMDDEGKEEEGQNRKISPAVAQKMKTAAIVFDVLSLIPGVGSISGAVAQILFAKWFKSLGVNPFSSQRLLMYITTWIVELIPVVNWLPSISMMVRKNILASNLEDKVRPTKEKRRSKARRFMRKTSMNVIKANEDGMGRHIARVKQYESLKNVSRETVISPQSVYNRPTMPNKSDIIEK